MSLLDSAKEWLKPVTKEADWFEIPQTNFIDQDPLEGAFEADETYFEIVTHTIFLRHRREYWRGFLPLGVTLTRSIYGGSWEEMPFVIGPQLLGKLEQVKEGDHITYRNVRVAGPQPYMGDWVTLFTGLWRSPTKNIAEEVISFAETIGSAIKTPQLSACLAVAKPLVAGLETLLGMDKLKLRVGHLHGFTPDPGPSRFHPAYFAMIRAPDCDESKFWVKEDRLHFGDSAQSAEPYVDADHMLFSIKCLEKRGDITTFPFYKYWTEAVKKVWEKKDAEADAHLHRLLSELAGSPDFTTRHRWWLALWYKKRLEAEKQKRDAKAEGWSKDELKRRVGEASSALSKRVVELAEGVGFSQQAVQGMQRGQTLFERGLESMLAVEQKGEPSEDELAAGVLDYAAELEKQEFAPEELAAVLYMVR